MAGDSKGDNKLFQLAMVVITTIVAPVAVYFITHSLQTPSGAAVNTQPTSTLVSQVSGAAITATSTIPLVTPASPAATALPGVQNPRGFLPAGETGAVDGLAVQVQPDAVQAQDDWLGVTIHVRNLSGEPQTFVYTAQSLALKDSSGRVLEVQYGEKRGACSKKDLSAQKKIELAPDEELVLRSVEAGQENGWCASDELGLLPSYKMASKDTPESIVIEFNGFGPFKGFGFEIEL